MLGLARAITAQAISLVWPGESYAPYVRQPGAGHYRAEERLQRHRQIWDDLPIGNTVTRQQQRRERIKEAKRRAAYIRRNDLQRRAAVNGARLGR
jgi:hypothetical protein